MYPFPENAQSLTFQEDSLKLTGEEYCLDIRPSKVMSENGCNGDETAQDWTGEIGSLLDDDVTARESTNTASKEDGSNDLERANSAESVNNQINKEGQKSHRPRRLHHHLSWQNALKKAQSLPDPWEKFHIDDSCPTEVAIRHRYNALKKNWVQDEVRVKMEALVSSDVHCYIFQYCSLKYLIRAISRLPLGRFNYLLTDMGNIFTSQVYFS